MNRIKQVTRAIKSVLDVAYWPALLNQRAGLDATENWSDVVQDVCRPRGRRRILANQNPAEIGALCELVRPMRPKVIVEIGTSQGGTLYLFSRLIQPGGLIISIDKPGEPSSVRPVMRAVYRTFGQKSKVQVITLDRDSHAASTHREFEQLLAGRPIDVLFIDGDHSYEGVKADFETYRQWVSPQGLIAMHDIAHADRHRTIQVPRFWNELSKRPYEFQSIVAVPGQSPGIGVVRGASAAMPLAKVA